MAEDMAEEQRMPPYFPLKLRACSGPSETFFACFESASFPNGSRDVAQQALASCSVELLAYKKCMEAHLPPSSLPPKK